MGTELYAQKRDGEEREAEGSGGLQESRCRAFGGYVCQVGILYTASFLQTIARANVPWSDAWRGSRCSMDTNRCHRASECALQAPRMAIAVPDDLRESVE